VSGHPDGGVDPQQLRARLHQLTDTIEPAPDYLDRLRDRLRPARRRRTAGVVTAAGLAVALGATAVVVGPLVRDRQPPVRGPSDLPGTVVAAAVEPMPPFDRELLQRDPARASALMEQYARTRRSALLRVDTASGEVRSVIYQARGRDLSWALRDDGSAVVETGHAACSFDLRSIAPDGRQRPLGTISGFQGNTGSSLASFAFSADGRLLAVTGTSCPDRKWEGALHWRLAVYRVGARIDPDPLFSATLADRPDGQFPNVGEPSFSPDGRHVVFPTETGQGSFDPARGVSGRIVTAFLHLDLAQRPKVLSTREVRTVRPSGARCYVAGDRLRFGRDPATLTAVEACPGAQHLVDVDLASGRTRPRLRVPSQPALHAVDYDAARTHLLLQQAGDRAGGVSLVSWDGGRSLRPVLDLKEARVGGVTYWISGTRW
jgi:WD40-like Beta Propeller Repeat